MVNQTQPPIFPTPDIFFPQLIQDSYTLYLWSRHFELKFKGFAFPLFLAFPHLWQRLENCSLSDFIFLLGSQMDSFSQLPLHLSVATWLSFGQFNVNPGLAHKTSHKIFHALFPCLPGPRGELWGPRWWHSDWIDRRGLVSEWLHEAISF